MASSSDSFSVGEFNVATFMINVGSPWSEAEPGTKFADWWAQQQFQDQAPILEMGNSDQQREWVTCMSSRVGVNGLMKPLKGLSEAAQLQLGGRQPSGGGMVKVVLRPVRASPDCSTFGPRIRSWGQVVDGLPSYRAALQDGQSGRSYAQPSKQHVAGLPPLR